MKFQNLSLCSGYLHSWTNHLYLHLSGVGLEHVFILHASDFEDDPWQVLPPFWADCLICLVAVLCPGPHVFEQDPHAVQCDHWQSTTIKINIFTGYTLCFVRFFKQSVIVTFNKRSTLKTLPAIGGLGLHILDYLIHIIC